MEITLTKLPDSQLEITSEIPAADFDRAVLRALREWNEKANLPGFRPGKIPENLLIETVGMNAILERAAEITLTEAYPKILADQKIDAIGHPKVSITKMARGNALGFKAITAVVPALTLPDYKTIAHEAVAAHQAPIAVENKEIADALEYLRSAHATKTEAGEEQKPELDDTFAQKLGQKTLVDLNLLLSENIRADKERRTRDRKRMEALEKISEKTPGEIPQLLMDAEKEKMLSELKESLTGMNLPWDDYLKHIKKTEEDLKKEWQPEAEKRVRYSLITREIAKIEKIEPAEADVAAYAEKILARYPEAERAKIDKGRLAGYAYGMLQNEKVFELLENA